MSDPTPLPSNLLGFLGRYFFSSLPSAHSPSVTFWPCFLCPTLQARSPVFLLRSWCLAPCPTLSCKPGPCGLSQFLSRFLSRHSLCVKGPHTSISAGSFLFAVTGNGSWTSVVAPTLSLHLTCHHPRLFQSERAFQHSLCCPQRTVHLLSVALKAFRTCSCPPLQTCPLPP